MTTTDTTFDPTDRSMCERPVHTTPRLLNGDWRSEAERQVHTAAQVAAVFARVASFYRHRLDIDINRVLSTECIRLDDRLPSGVTGLASWVLETPGERVHEVGIRLRPGSTPLCTAGVLAHEAFHILSATWRLKLSRRHEEGLANLAQYLFLKHEPGPYAAWLAEQLHADEDPIYGDGFRQARRVYRQEGGFRRAVAALQHARAPKPLAEVLDSIVLAQKGARS